MINCVFFRGKIRQGLKVFVGFSTKEVVNDLAERNLLQLRGEEAVTVNEWGQLILLSLSKGMQLEIYSWS